MELYRRTSCAIIVCPRTTLSLVLWTKVFRILVEYDNTGNSVIYKPRFSLFYGGFDRTFKFMFGVCQLSFYEELAGTKYIIFSYYLQMVKAIL